MINRNIVVSGGSRGLGLHIVRHLLGQGCGVGTFARTETPAMVELGKEFPSKFRFTACDSRDTQNIETFLAQFEAQVGPIGGLVNNAAVGQDHLLSSMGPGLIHDILAINIEAPILLTRLIVRRLLLQGEGGAIVNISSICGMRGFQGLTVYSASKGAMDAFSRSLARELGERSIRVNSIAPGFFESDMSRVLAPSQLEAIKRRTPTGVMTVESQILPALDLLLFSDSNMTGQTLVIDGGATN